jgi:hypothetical protein
MMAMICEYLTRKGMWKAAAVAKFKIQSLHLPGGADENDSRPSGRMVSGPKFEI